LEWHQPSTEAVDLSINVRLWSGFNHQWRQFVPLIKQQPKKWDAITIRVPTIKLQDNTIQMAKRFELFILALMSESLTVKTTLYSMLCTGRIDIDLQLENI
jgi:hypothetical protein